MWIKISIWHAKNRMFKYQASAISSCWENCSKNLERTNAHINRKLTPYPLKKKWIPIYGIPKQTASGSSSCWVNYYEKFVLTNQQKNKNLTWAPSLLTVTRVLDMVFIQQETHGSWQSPKYYSPFLNLSCLHFNLYFGVFTLNWDSPEYYPACII